MKRRRRVRPIGMILVTIAFVSYEPNPLAGQGVIAGEIRESGTGDPVSDVLVRVWMAEGEDMEGVRTGTTSLDGSFRIGGLSPGSYSLATSALGWRRESVEGVSVEDGGTRWLDVGLQPLPLSLADLVVHVGKVPRRQLVGPSRVILNQAALRARPHFGDDVFRALHHLPGMASTEFSSRLHLRGSASNALHVRLDGLELIDPFHLKDLGGALSIVDEDALAFVTLQTGGVSASERTRGVGALALRTIGTGVLETRTSLGLSLSVARVLSLGPLAGGRGMWMLSARRGFLDLLVDATDRQYEAKPRYHDVMGKVEWRLTDEDRVSAHVLTAGDDLRHSQDDLDYRGTWRDTYVWLKWDHGSVSRLSANTVLSAGTLRRHRTGGTPSPESGADGAPDSEADGGSRPSSIHVSDRRELDFLTIEQDWSFAPSPWLRLEWGGSMTAQRVRYDYSRTGPAEERIEVDPFLEGRVYGAHASLHLADGAPFALELGMRYDRQRHTGESQVSPRVSASLDLGRNTTLRGGWGLYWKPQRIQALAVEEGRIRFYEAQLAREVSLGIEHQWGRYALGKIEAYRRRIADPIPYYLNLDMEVRVLPEAGRDRIFVDPESGLSRGVEITLFKPSPGSVDWSLSYTLSSVSDRWHGTSLRKPWDQRHAFKALASVRPAEGWLFSISERLHTGWPATDPRLVEGLKRGTTSRSEVLPHLNQRNLRPYHRTDLRIARNMTLGSTLLQMYVDVLNVFNQSNTRSLGITNVVVDGVTKHEEHRNTYFPRFFSFGITWTF